MKTLVFYKRWYEIDQKNMVPCASAVESLRSAQTRTYPDIVHLFGLFWQKSNLDIDHWNGVNKNDMQFCKVLHASC